MELMGDFCFTDPALACDLGFHLAYKCAEELAKDDSKQVGLILPEDDNYREPLVTQMLSAAEKHLGKTGASRLTKDVMIFRLNRSGFHSKFTRGPVIVPFVSMVEAGKVRTNLRATTVIWVPASARDVDISLVEEWNGLMLASAWNGPNRYVAYTPRQQQDLGNW